MMRKLLLTTAAMFAVLCLAGTAFAEPVCSVTVTADCDTVTLHFTLIDDEASFNGTVRIGEVVAPFSFTGATGEFTLTDTTSTTADVKGVVTYDEHQREVHAHLSIERDCAATTPPPSTPPPSHQPTTPAPPVAFTGGPSPWILVGAGGLLLVFLGSLFAWRRA